MDACTCMESAIVCHKKAILLTGIVYYAKTSMEGDMLQLILVPFVKGEVTCSHLIVKYLNFIVKI